MIEAQLARVLSFFPRVESKAAGLFAINSAILTIGALNVHSGDLRHWYVAVPGVLMLIALAVSYTFLYRCNFPQIDGGQGSLIFFGEIKNRSEANFIKQYEDVSEADYRADLLGQIWRNSQILSQKYEAMSVAIRLTLATLLPFAIFLIMTAVEHSRFPLVKS